jgi:heme/copper-type cytochrome/quinol oxidase subunit 3
VVGLGLLVWLAAPALRRDARVPGRVPVKLASMFWHFVDVVWVIMFVTLYVL